MEEVVAQPVYGLVGTFNDWSTTAFGDAYTLTKSSEKKDGKDMYILNGLELAADAEFKVVGVLDDTVTWYPEGMGNNYKVAAAGKYDIHFVPAGGIEGWHGGFFSVTAAQEEPVGTNPIVFADLGLENSVQYSDPFVGNGFTVTFTGGGNDGKYYTTGTGIRVYGGGAMTVTSTVDAKMASIEIAFDGSYKPDSDSVVNVGTYDPAAGVWTGDAASVSFTRPSGSGHWRVKSVKVTFAE
ncbi:MAG: hypothetical protein IKR29_05830 [Bacteroidales bacterium]|nr:hypothetical protein [Bacteroidales bacterium]